MSSIRRYIFVTLAVILSSFTIGAQNGIVVVADSASRKTLPGASIFDRQGNPLGLCDINGRSPYLPKQGFPVTVRYLGYKEKTFSDIDADTVFLQESQTELPEVIISSRRHKVLHMLAYVREYSTLTTYSDTVFMFREKMVDFMLTPDKKARFKGWSNPRVIKANSYYRMTDSQGIDSVSDVNPHHFSWSDWIGIGIENILPQALRNADCANDTVMGKYSPTELWTKKADRVSVNINVLADTLSRKWVPNLSSFFRQHLDFENFRVRFNYVNILSDNLSPADLTSYSFNIESNGRGHDMFMFNRIDEPFFVSTYAEVYMLDKEYITVKEARKWAALKFDNKKIAIYRPPEITDLQPEILALIDRVNNIDKDNVRSSIATDPNIGYEKDSNHNFRFGNRVLMLLKEATGITLIRSRRNFNHKWDDFKAQWQEQRKQSNKKK